MCPHSGDSSVDGISSAQEDNSIVGLNPTLKVPDLGQIRAFTWDRRIQSVGGISPTSGQFLQVPPNYGDKRGQLYL